jgi:hypothetical protein
LYILFDDFVTATHPDAGILMDLDAQLSSGFFMVALFCEFASWQLHGRCGLLPNGRRFGQIDGAGSKFWSKLLVVTATGHLQNNRPFRKTFVYAPVMLANVDSLAGYR